MPVLGFKNLRNPDQLMQPKKHSADGFPAHSLLALVERLAQRCCCEIKEPAGNMIQGKGRQCAELMHNLTPRKWLNAQWELARNAIDYCCGLIGFKELLWLVILKIIRM